MKTKYLLYLLLSMPFWSLAQGEPDTTYIPFVAYWAKGDTYNFKVTKILKKWINEKQVKDDSSSYVATFEVLDSTENSYTIQWSFETNLGDFNIPLALLKKYPQYKTTKVIYTTDELGSFVDIINWKEIGESMKGLKKELAKSIAEKTKAPLETVEKELPFLDVYTTKEGIELLILQELQYLHGPFGLEYPHIGAINYEDVLPNLFGGEPIKAKAKMYVTSLDTSQQFCTLVQEVEIDKEDMRKTIAEIYQHGSDQNKALINKAELDIKDYNTFSYHYYPGVPVHIENRRDIAVSMGAATSNAFTIIRIELMD